MAEVTAFPLGGSGDDAYSLDTDWEDSRIVGLLKRVLTQGTPTIFRDVVTDDLDNLFTEIDSWI